MPPFLKNIKVRDFRSLRGEIDITLDAPVILIHGNNGVGKTSLLSAIELALTGDVTSLRRIDPKMLDYLPHRESKNGGGVFLEVEGATPTADISISNSEIVGSPVLGHDDIRFFNERCYLAQSTLTRLLEIYQFQEKKSESSLTRFVKELLGLDNYDALIDGLHIAGNVKRLREPAPMYWSARDKEVDLSNELTGLREKASLAEQLLGKSKAELSLKLSGVEPAIAVDLENSDAVRAALAGRVYESELSSIAKLRRDLAIAGEQLSANPQTLQRTERGVLEQSAAVAAQAYAAWDATFGVQLRATMDELRQYVTLVSPPSSATPELSRASSEQSAAAELMRIDQLLASDDAVLARLNILAAAVAAGTARSSTLDSQISSLVGVNDGLAKSLSSLQTHIHDENCPVCDRDFSETSKVSLSEYVSSKIAALIEAAGRLQALSRERASTVAELSKAQQESGSLASRALQPEQKNQLKIRRARLDELRVNLASLKEATSQGSLLANSRDQLALDLGKLGVRDQSDAFSLATINEASVRLGLNPIAEGESALERASILQAQLMAREETLLRQQATVRDANVYLQTIGTQTRELQQINDQISQKMNDLLIIGFAKAEADRRIEVAKSLSRAAKEARTGIVRRVFNEDLNAVWRTLFVRLAPDEDFVPAFALPEDAGGAVEAELETHYRSGGRGGNPRAMLSAGNLNTAALTLFLALHLSVKPLVPCLIIDDPVQSMDEVHISQFAALLRTLSKEMGRQVVIAVHERALFEYLALELSPSFEGDRLITVELSRALDGQSLARWEIKTFVPDKAIAA